jgi:transposase
MPCFIGREPAANGVYFPMIFLIGRACVTILTSGPKTAPGSVSTTPYVERFAYKRIVDQNPVLVSLIVKVSKRLSRAANAATTREKNVKGRKRTLLVDTTGLVLRVLVHPANIHDSEGAEWLLAYFRRLFPTLKLVWVDSGYKGWIVEDAQTYYDLTLEVVHKPADQIGFAVQPRRWVVERTFAWLGRNRRLSKDYEKLPENSETAVYIASIRLLLKRLSQ